MLWHNPLVKDIKGRHMWQTLVNGHQVKNCYDTLYASNAAVMIKAGLWLQSVLGLGLGFELMLRLGVVSVL